MLLLLLLLLLQSGGICKKRQGGRELRREPLSLSPKHLPRGGGGRHPIPGAKSTEYRAPLLQLLPVSLKDSLLPRVGSSLSPLRAHPRCLAQCWLDEEWRVFLAGHDPREIDTLGGLSTGPPVATSPGRIARAQ